MLTRKIKELEEALSNHELGEGRSPTSHASPALSAHRHIYSITAAVEFNGKVSTTVHAESAYVEELLRNNPDAVSWTRNWIDDATLLYVKVNGITYSCVRIDVQEE